MCVPERVGILWRFYPCTWLMMCLIRSFVLSEILRCDCRPNSDTTCRRTARHRLPGDTPRVAQSRTQQSDTQRAHPELSYLLRSPLAEPVSAGAASSDLGNDVTKYRTADDSYDGPWRCRTKTVDCIYVHAFRAPTHADHTASSPVPREQRTIWSFIRRSHRSELAFFDVQVLP